ncbi:MAG TPA: ferritin-like domain-containing protein [Gemmatimonadaceae bacterium]
MASSKKNQKAAPQKPAADDSSNDSGVVTREQLIAALNEDLAREYQAIIAYVIYSQAIKGAQYMSIAKELEKHAAEELSHALTIAKQIDYLGGDITATPKPVKTSDKAEDMLRFDLENERVTILEYRKRLMQCEELGEFAISEHIREILLDEQEHLTDLATALGEDPPKLSSPMPRRRA